MPTMKLKFLLVALCLTRCLCNTDKRQKANSEKDSDTPAPTPVAPKREEANQYERVQIPVASDDKLVVPVKDVTSDEESPGELSAPAVLPEESVG